jgi:uncharacterized protein YjdB
MSRASNSLGTALSLLAVVVWSGCSGQEPVIVIVGSVEVTPDSFHLDNHIPPPVQLSASVHDNGGSVILGAAVTWSSSDVTVATVNNDGLVTLFPTVYWEERLASATITATAGGVSGTSELTYAQVTALTRVIPLDVAVDVGTTGQLTAQTFDASGSAETTYWETIVWSSDDPAVATVDQNGLVTGVAVGTTRIRAIASTGTGGSSVVTVMLPY